MLLKKPILLVSLVSILMSGFLNTSYAKQRWNLLEGIEANPSEFKELEIGEKIVYWYQRKIGEAIVEKDQIVYQFDKKNQELLDVKVNWRDDLPDVLPKLKITKEEAELMVEGTVDFSQLFIISPESDVFPIMTPENPCWVVESVENDIVTVKVIDAVEGTMLGYGIPPPSYTGFSLTGPQYFWPCRGAWTAWATNARNWFNTMGYSTEYVVWPTEAKVKSHIQSNRTAMFYELAHGGSTSFTSGCSGGQSGESTTASEIETWIADYCKMPFAFIGSCGGMCSTGNNTLSYEFRKGSTEDTATVGYCGMAGANCSTYCWYAGYTIPWQTTLFTYMNDGNTVKEAFDEANADYPGCSNYNCMRFAGDEDFAVVPVIKRVPLDDEDKFYVKNNSGDPVAWLGDLGNVVLKGTFTSGGTCTAPSGSFIVKSSAGDTVAYIDNQGNMCIEGTLSEEAGSCNPTTDAFIIKDSTGAKVIYIEFADGDMCIKGKLYENAEP